MNRVNAICVGMFGKITMYLMILSLGTTAAAAASTATTAAAAVIPGNNRIMENELTRVLQEALSVLDPYFVSYTSTFSYTNSTSSIEMNVTNTMMSGFGDIVVTNFDPPVPFFSKQVNIDTVVSNLTLSTDSYSMVAICDVTNEVYKSHGAAYLVFHNLKVHEQFKANEYSTDPVEICVKCGTLAVDISYDSVEGNFEGAGLIMNSMIPLFGEKLVEKISDILAENQDILEESLNNALCSNNDYQACRQT